MNTADDNPSKIEQRLFDLLVDGELNEQQRRDLLASLDDTRDGWRQCALAFLQAQCLEIELGPISHRQPTEPPTQKQPAVGVLPGKPWRTLLAVAASFLLALGLGIYGRGLLFPNQGVMSPPVEVAEVADVPEVAPSPHQTVSDAALDPDEDADSWRMVSFPVSRGSDEVEMIQLPAVERDTMDEVWQTNLPQGIPPEVIRAIENSGHRVRSERRLLPLRMKDGRRLVVPVDQVEIHYVGAPAYH